MMSRQAFRTEIEFHNSCISRLEQGKAVEETASTNQSINKEQSTNKQ